MLKLCRRQILFMRALVFSFLILLLGCTDPKKVPIYISQLSSSKASERNDAALELGYIGAPHAKKAVPYLIPLLTDPNPGVQSAAAYALRRIDTLEARSALERVSTEHRK